MTAQIDPTDPMFKPLTMREVLEITERSQRTIRRWIDGGHLKAYTAYEQAHRRHLVFNEDEVVEVEKQMHDADMANKERIRARGGRPGPRPSGTTVSGDVPA